MYDTYTRTYVYIRYSHTHKYIHMYDTHIQHIYTVVVHLTMTIYYIQVLFSLPYLGSTLSVYMAGLVSLVATVYDYESDLGLPLSHSTNTDILLISNAAPPGRINK